MKVILSPGILLFQLVYKFCLCAIYFGTIFLEDDNRDLSFQKTKHASLIVFFWELTASKLRYIFSGLI